MIYDESSNLVLWNYIPHKESLEQVKNAMKENLGLKEKEVTKTFTFDIDKGYKETVIGDGKFKEPQYKYPLLPDLTTYTLEKADSWAKENNMTLEIIKVVKPGKKSGTIIKQQYPVSKRLDRIEGRKLAIEVVDNSDKDETIPDKTTDTGDSNPPTKVDCLVDYSVRECTVPNFVGKTKADVRIWGNKFSNVVNIDYEYEETSDAKEGTIISQSASEGTYVRTILETEKPLKIVVAIKPKE
jgi:beta-lactam-binding protein with PASTA domain